MLDMINLLDSKSYYHERKTVDEIDSYIRIEKNSK